MNPGLDLFVYRCSTECCAFSLFLPQEHVATECPKRRVNCSNLALGCVEVVPLDELQEHLEKLCKKRVVECRLDCGIRVACDNRTEHEVHI